MTDKNIKKVSKKKIIFVELDEEITKLYERIASLPYKEIYLVVPKRAVLLQSIVNLKILKQKLEDIDKSMALITKDTGGMKLAHQAEIKIFDHWDIDSSEQKHSKENSESTLLAPVTATSNDVSELSPSRLPQKKSSIFEVVRSLRGKEKGFSLQSYLRDRKKNRVRMEPIQIQFPGGTRRFITGLALASVALFLFIAYVVLPGATLYIEPASNVVSKAVNINLTLNPSTPRDIKAYPLETQVEWTLTHAASGILSEGANAEGDITIYNTSAQDWPLIASTRFQTDEGLVFRIQEAVTVPSGSLEEPGTAVAHVLADPLDANGVATGQRGNIGPSRFFLPGLREESRGELYGESETDMTGGESLVSAIVTEDDIIAAREKLEAQLREKVLSSLRKEALAESNRQGTELKLLEDSDTLIYGAPDIDMPFELIGTEMEDFEITGSLSLVGVAYDNEALLAILKSEVVTVETPGKQLIRIDEDTVSINVLEFDNLRISYKFTAQIQGVEEYEIDPELEGGSKLSKKIKEHIAGKSIEEAERYVQNLPEVNTVQIKIWPAWSPTIPSLPENIKIKSLSHEESIQLEE